MHWLHQDPVDLLAKLNHVRRGDPTLDARRCREHIFVQRAPGEVGE